MRKLKQYFKCILPDFVIYIFYIIKLFPKYIKAVCVRREEDMLDVRFYTDEETVDLIINERKSLSRFGDGEFMWMVGEKLDSYQKYSDEFSNDLITSFQSKNPNLLIGIPYGIFDSSKCNIYAKMHWKIIRLDVYSRLKKFIEKEKIYCNASITRPYIDYRDREYSEKQFLNLKRIWEQKEIIFVEGEKTKLGIGNDLFNNAKSIKRIICPAHDAYERLTDIKQAIIKNVDKSDLILTALGPTASILASQMCDLGYQIIDIGHIDIEYSWYLNHSILRDEVPGKYVNESGKKECSDVYDNNKEYLTSILEKIV